jgi:hypothetical protein
MDERLNVKCYLRDRMVRCPQVVGGERVKLY